MGGRLEGGWNKSGFLFAATLLLSVCRGMVGPSENDRCTGPVTEPDFSEVTPISVKRDSSNALQSPRGPRAPPNDIPH